jgi:hypothetical protein
LWVEEPSLEDIFMHFYQKGNKTWLFICENFIRNRIALIVWTVTMILFSVFLMTFFPTIREQAVELQRLMEQYPKELVAAFNFDG